MRIIFNKMDEFLELSKDEPLVFYVNGKKVKCPLL